MLLSSIFHFTKFAFIFSEFQDKLKTYLIIDKFVFYAENHIQLAEISI